MLSQVSEARPGAPAPDGGLAPGVQRDEVVGVAIAADEVGCGGDAGSAVGAEGEVASIVEDDVGGEAALLIADDAGGEAQGDALGRGLAPVVGDGVPEDRFHAEIACGAQHVGTARAEGRTEVADGLACDLREGVLSGAELFTNFGGGGESEVGVGPGVVADEVAALLDAANEIGDDLGVAADEEEGCADAVLGEVVEELRGPGGVGSVVEGKGEIAGALGSAERGAEEGGRRPHGGVGVSAEGEAGGGKRAEAGDQAGLKRREHVCLQCAVRRDGFARAARQCRQAGRAGICSPRENRIGNESGEKK